jgi:hypothetical protein
VDKFKTNVVKLKYIVIERAGMEIPLVFPSLLLHHEVAGNNKVKSAGYCKFDAAGKWITVGKSETLNLSARPQDEEILNAHLRDTDFTLSTKYQPVG